jgi:hypothetical protein
VKESYPRGDDSYDQILTWKQYGYKPRFVTRTHGNVFS